VKLLRLVTVLFAFALMAGEAYRSWGVERAPLLWIDDMLIGASLVAAAVIVAKDQPRRRAFFSGMWGVTVGALYISAFTTWFDPVTVQVGGFSLIQMQVLIAVAFSVAILCLAASLVIPFAPPVDPNAGLLWPGAEPPPLPATAPAEQKPHSDSSKTAAQ
jgi:hypothetical protein